MQGRIHAQPYGILLTAFPGDRRIAHFFQQGFLAGSARQHLAQMTAYTSQRQQRRQRLRGKPERFTPEFLHGRERVFGGEHPFPIAHGQHSFAAQQTMQPAGVLI